MNHIERKLLVEVTVQTNIVSVSKMRTLIREGLVGMSVTDIKDHIIYAIEITNIEGIDLRETS